MGQNERPASAVLRCVNPPNSRPRTQRLYFLIVATAVSRGLSRGASGALDWTAVTLRRSKEARIETLHRSRNAVLIAAAGMFVMGAGGTASAFDITTPTHHAIAGRTFTINLAAGRHGSQVWMAPG